METTKQLFPEAEAEIAAYERAVAAAEVAYAEALAALEGNPLLQARQEVDDLAREVAFHRNQGLEAEFSQAEMILEKSMETDQYETQLQRLSEWQPSVPPEFDQSMRKLTEKITELERVLENSPAPPDLIAAYQQVKQTAATGDLLAMEIAQTQLDAAVAAAGIPPLPGNIPPPPGTEALVNETAAIQDQASSYAKKPSEELADAEARYAQACDKLQQEEQKATADVRKAEQELKAEQDRLAGAKQKLARLERTAKGG